MGENRLANAEFLSRCAHRDLIVLRRFIGQLNRGDGETGLDRDAGPLDFDSLG